MFEGMVERGRAIPVHPWWLRLARNLVLKDTRDLITLGKDLARRIDGKKKPFNYTQLSRFSQAQTGVTLELAEALCKEYRLPPPVLFPRSYEESVAMIGTSEKYGNNDPIRTEEADVVPLQERRARRRRSTAQPVTVQTTHSHAASAGGRRRSRS